MKKTVFLFMLFIISLSVASCSSTNRLHKETYKGKEILVGIAKRSDLLTPPYKKWFNENYYSYQVDNQTINQLKPFINNYNFIVLLGTWCPDSQEQVPVLFKVLDKSDFKGKIKLITLPRKYGKSTLAKPYNIIRVPTIIVYKNKLETGRIIEYPMKSIEKDLKKMIIDRNYHHELNK